MNYNWTNNAYWLLRLRLKPGAWTEVRSVSRRLPDCLPVLRSVEPPAAGCLQAACCTQAVKRADWWA